MKATLTFLSVLLLVVVAGCKTGPKQNTGWGDGEKYADVVVPGNYIEYDDPSFKRQDGANGARIYGRYAYRSKEDALDDPQKVADFLKTNMAHEGWELMVEEVKPAESRMMVRFKKGEDQVVLTLSKDQRPQASDRFSVLVVEMNPTY